MSATAIAEQATNASPRARSAGLFYLLNIVTGAMSMAFPGRGADVVNFIAALCYIAVAVLFYGLFKPVNRTLSLLAAISGLAGCVVSILRTFHIAALPIGPFAFFGIYCLLIGYLVFRSTFLPRSLGIFLAVGGLGWLTLAVPALASRLSPYNALPGVVSETALTLWLLVKGVDVPRWREQASGAKPSPVPDPRS